MFLENLLLIFIGIAAGGVISAGTFAFITIIGMVPRLAGKTGTKKHLRLYEDCIVLGAAAGNIMDLYRFPLFGGKIAAGIFGLFSGIFVGVLVLSLAETLDAVPVLARRIRLSVGIQYVILALAAGKCLGAFLYFWRQ